MRRKFAPKSPLLLVVFVLIAGCFTMNLTPGQVSEMTYTSARAVFNRHLETYLVFRDAMASGPAKDAVRAEYEPLFVEINKALDAWSVAIGTGDEQDKARMANNLIDLLVTELIKGGVIKGE